MRDGSVAASSDGLQLLLARHSSLAIRAQLVYAQGHSARSLVCMRERQSFELELDETKDGEKGDAMVQGRA